MGHALAQSTQGQQVFDFARRIPDAHIERPVWRRQASAPLDDRGGALPNQDQDRTDRFRNPNRTDRGHPYQEPDRGDRSPPTRSLHQEQQTVPVPRWGAPLRSAEQFFHNEEKQATSIGNVDTGDRSGLDALLQHAQDTKKSSGSSRVPTQADSRDRRFRAPDTMARKSTKFKTQSNKFQVSQSYNALESISPLPPATALEPVLNGGDGDEDILINRKECRRADFQPRHEEADGEGSQRPRGRFQSDLDEPQIAETRFRPRRAKRTARRAPSRGSGYDLEDPDEELLSGRRNRKKKSNDKSAAVAPARTPVQLPEFISVKNLATVLRVRTEDFISRMEDMGFERPRHDHVLDAETSGLIASEFNFEPIHNQGNQVEDLVARPLPADVTSIPQRPPIVTIMGHVDHGKTTILDWLRKSSVAKSEHGGITQHIGAFSVAMPGGKHITFLDTPGHAAFLDMRRRGANVTDIVILVVAADDSVKPQTLEAIKHATDAKVPLIVAINKVDKEDADVERVKQDLARHGITVEDYGGEVQAIPVSGKVGKGMEDLEEATVTLSELLDYRAELDGPVEGWIIESKVTAAGRVATVLVRRGTLRPGDIIVAGTTWARIRTLRNDAGVLVDEALPGTPVQIDGWRGDDPIAGWEVLQAEDEDRAKDVVELRQEREEFEKLAGDTVAINTIRTEEAEARAKVLAWEAEQEWALKKVSRRPKDNAGWVEGKAAGGPKQIHFVVKADVSGSVEAVVNSISAIGNNEIATNVIRSGVGVINESDVQHLASSREAGYLISFNQPVDGNVAKLAEAAGLAILDHSIIYKVIDVVREKLTAELPSAITQRVVGEAEISEVFEISVKKGKAAIAGCKISNGIISRDKNIRVLRGTNVLYDGQ
jgi:translation initiation factor IF-2